LQRHGIPVNAKNDDIRMAAEWTMEGTAKPSGEWLVQPTKMQLKRNRWKTVNSKKI